MGDQDNRAAKPPVQVLEQSKDFFTGVAVKLAGSDKWIDAQ